MASTELEQRHELLIGKGAGEVHPLGVVLAFDLRQETILPLALGTCSSITHSLGLPHDHQASLWMETLQFRNGTNERMTAPIRLQTPIHKGDDGLPLLKHSSVGQLERSRRWIGNGLAGVHTIVNDGDPTPPVLREAAGLKVCG